MKDEIKLIVRQLRKNQTEGEGILWKRLRNRGFLQIKFLRQQPLIFKFEGKKIFFVADFLSYQKKLVIEVDGKIHLRQKDHDQYRDVIIKELGFKVIRVSNEAIKSNPEDFLSKILYPACNC
ncbi:MAG: endonuclease domain-containing protein [Acidobacteria bacterium]|nr:endonuclease domain-containing protein [Acidobacteriota bacterium]